ncbi:echinoderm microtubule-associated protein-like 1 [Boleophthalmus pectinirostris]|uniref:echinoderm microtubule-associated protein-like 1 n=1 Tax=Boleophthalmus pectinirostris TaxID=150288 RepID=UPI00243042D2|nr:echinoderm microtubule-associated protein-like 1 [Boleophthalmus pectinirostris]
MAGEEGPQPRQTDPYSLLTAPQDDRSSAASGLDVADRLTYLEQRMQMQEDEIQLLKMALADVLKRLNLNEEHQASTAAGRRAGGKAARPVSLALPSRPAALKKSCTVPSSGAARTYSPTPSSSSVKSPPGSVKDSPSKTKTRTSSSSSAASASKKPDQDSTKPKEAAVTLGTRRVTHCKVTMQIYLSPLAKRTGSSEVAKTAATVTTKTKPPATNNAPNLSKGKTGTGNSNHSTKTEKKFTLNLQKTSTSVNNSAPQETSSYHSPVKSPSQYFQICY